jgi:Dihydrodipicolinate synthetase family
LAKHCGWLLEAGGCDAVNLLGTTGEATSFSVQQRLAAMSRVSRSGLPMSRLMVGTGAAALADALALTKAADDLGFAGVLLVPPFCHKAISEDALTGYLQRIIDEASLKRAKRLSAAGLKPSRMASWHLRPLPASPPRCGSLAPRSPRAPPAAPHIPSRP